MKLKVFTLRHSPHYDGFNDQALDAFCGAHEVLSVSEHFYVHETTPTLALVVSYREPTRADGFRRGHYQSGPDVAAEDRPLYDALRKWRNQRAAREGRPSYVLLLNAALADVAKRRPRSLTALKDVPGFGDGKIEAYGLEVIGLVNAVVPSIPAPPPEPEHAG